MSLEQMKKIIEWSGCIIIQDALKQILELHKELGSSEETIAQHVQIGCRYVLDNNFIHNVILESPMAL